MLVSLVREVRFLSCAQLCNSGVVVIGGQLMGYEDLVYDGYFVEDVLFQMQSGKEATVFCCRAQEHTGLNLVAAKVYRRLEERSFRNDSIYQQGRYINDARLRRAFLNKSRTGRNAQYCNWVSAEYETMRLLFGADARIPQPYAQSGSTIIMEYFGTEETPASTLNRVHLSSPESKLLFESLISDIGLWLSCGRVHADLSAFNVLYQDGDYRVIDFPQSVDPTTNVNAFGLLLRDVENICQYFSRYGMDADAYDITTNLLQENTDRNAGIGRGGYAAFD